MDPILADALREAAPILLAALAGSAALVWARRSLRLRARKRAKAALRQLRRGQVRPGAANCPGG